MKVTLTSTTKIVELRTARGDAVPARLWEGKTESGIPVHAFITRIACAIDADAEEFERELIECEAPSREIDRAYPLRLLIG